MKAKIGFLAILLTVFLAFGSANGALVDGSGKSILLIDGDDGFVSPEISHRKASYDVYYSLNNSSEWHMALESNTGSFTLGPFAGGSVIDFAIDTDNNGTVDYFSRNSEHAIIEYGSIISHYYRNVYIDWFILDDPDLKLKWQLEILGAQNTDGFAPVPLPGALLLLGSGLIGFIGFRKFGRK